jgi:hypothetical protein
VVTSSISNFSKDDKHDDFDRKTLDMINFNTKENEIVLCVKVVNFKKNIKLAETSLYINDILAFDIMKFIINSKNKNMKYCINFEYKTCRGLKNTIFQIIFNSVISVELFEKFVEDFVVYLEQIKVAKTEIEAIRESFRYINRCIEINEMHT